MPPLHIKITEMNISFKNVWIVRSEHCRDDHSLYGKGVREEVLSPDEARKDNQILLKTPRIGDPFKKIHHCSKVWGHLEMSFLLKNKSPLK